jgi:hypothetical protein
MERLKNPRMIAALAVAVLAAIVFLQNRSPLVLKLLFLAKVETTVSTALIAAFLAGVLTGVLARWRSARHKARAARAA